MKATRELREFVLRFLSPAHVERSGLLSPAGVQRVIGEHLSGARDYSLQLWSILVLEAWYRMYIEDGVSDASGYRLADLRGAVERPARAAPSRAARLAPSLAAPCRRCPLCSRGRCANARR